MEDERHRNMMVFDEIDDIYKQEDQHVHKNIGNIKKEIYTWVSKNELNSNPQASFIKRDQINERKEIRRKKFEALSYEDVMQ